MRRFRKLKINSSYNSCSFFVDLKVLDFKVKKNSTKDLKCGNLVEQMHRFKIST